MKSEIYILEGVAFLDLLAVSLIIPLLSGHVRQLGGTHIQVGLMASIYSGFQLGSGPLIGSLSDLKGRRNILVVTLLLCSISYLCLGFTESVIIILCIRAILGLCKQTQMLSKALVADYVHNEERQCEIYGKMAAISGVGITIGPIVGGHIMEADPENGFLTLAGLVGICFCLNAVLVYQLPSKKLKKKTKKHISVLSNVTSSIKQSVLELYKIKWSEYWDVFLFKGLIALAMSMFYSNYALYLKTVFSLSTKHVGYVISFHGIVGSLSSYCIGHINILYKTDYDFSRRNFHIFILLFASLCGMLLSPKFYFYVIWLIPLGVGNAIGRLVTLEMILRRSHGDHRGMMIGAANSTRSLAGVIGPMIAGVIGQYFGVIYVIYGSLFSTFLGLLISSRVKTVERNRLKDE